MSQICVIDGDYKDFSDLNEIIEQYKSKFNNIVKSIQSTDGSELYKNHYDVQQQQLNSVNATLLTTNDSVLNGAESGTNGGGTAAGGGASTNNNTTLASTTISASGSTAPNRYHDVDEKNTTYTCFVLDDFDNTNKTFTKLEDVLNKCSTSSHRFLIYGVPILRYCNERNYNLCKANDVDRPLYCNLMSDAIVCFTGFRKENKHIVAHCIRLVHYMGGSVRKEYNKRITHLIVKSTMSTKYKTAHNIGKCHLLTEEWIFNAWNHRNEIDFNVNDADFIKSFKLKALYSLSISFYGFSSEETQHMRDVTVENGGTTTDINDSYCTHIVVNDQDIKQLPANSVFCNTKASIVRAEWFWASIQICCRASECLYEFQRPKMEKNDPPTKRMKLSVDNLLADEIKNVTSSTTSIQTATINGQSLATTTTTTTSTLSNLILPMSSSHHINGDFESPIINHRLSNDHRNISTNLSTSASLLDATTDDAMSVDSPYETQKENASLGILNSAGNNNGNKKLSKRLQRIYELYETEKRFVNILHTIIFYFKNPIEAPDQAAGALLDLTEIKEIFGNVPPIYEVHCKIKDALEKLTQRIVLNDESISVGEIYLDNADALLKTYPPFINFYEKTKEVLINCDKTKPRFHAFLKIAQSKPECGRQTLVELLIRPVQRLPSTLLLLDDILKETLKSHRDNELLSKAISSLKVIMTHINEDKRKTESRIAMLEIMNNIENCPATLLSSHRNLTNKVDAYETSSELYKKGAQLTLFLFSDCLEICKPRLKVINASKSPTNKVRTPQKCYKHIALFSLNNITKVCDILQNGGDTELFGILCRFAGDKDKFFSFKIINGKEIDKKEYIKALAEGICNVKCITEYENVLCTIEAKQLQLDLNESGGSKKFDTMKRYASRINRRVSRAFSFSQDTPNKIKKTISSVFRSPFQGYSHSLHDQKASKLSSLASLQLTPTLLERRNNLLTNKSTYQLTKSAKNINLNDNPYDTITSCSSTKSHLHHYTYTAAAHRHQADDLTTTNIDDDDDDDDDGHHLNNENEMRMENDLINGKLLTLAKLKQQNNHDALSYDSHISNTTRNKISKRPFEGSDTLISSSSTTTTTTMHAPTAAALVNNTTVLNRKLEVSLTSLDSLASTIIGN